MSISIVTPVLDHPEFIPAYAAAVAGADEVIIVDTGCAAEHRVAWAATATRVSSYRIPGHNYGHWCNAGFQQATGDIIIFLNNDIEATGDWLGEVAAQVLPGALYGPELQAQVVNGIRVPFLSGWCIAATRETWAELERTTDVVDRDGAPAVLRHGPWDTVSFPGNGYWEDNTLSLDAVMLGLELRQTKWAIAHLGNGTAKHMKSAYADVERNKATFARLVRAAMQPKEPAHA